MDAPARGKEHAARWCQPTRPHPPAPLNPAAASSARLACPSGRRSRLERNTAPFEGLQRSTRAPLCLFALWNANPPLLLGRRCRLPAQRAFAQYCLCSVLLVLCTCYAATQRQGWARRLALLGTALAAPPALARPLPARIAGLLHRQNPTPPPPPAPVLAPTISSHKQPVPAAESCCKPRPAVHTRPHISCCACPARTESVHSAVPPCVMPLLVQLYQAAFRLQPVLAALDLGRRCPFAATLAWLAH